MERTVSCSNWRAVVMGMVLVTITSSNKPLESRSTAGGEKTGWVAQA